jgi:ABC-type branched-subunit amino acid transport system ATPase component
MLECEGISRAFGGLAALDGVSFHVRDGEIFGLIGPNGAGKTTLFNIITGFLPPSAGRVRFRGEDITGLGPDRIAARGIVRTFQNIRLFPDLSVLENVGIGQHLCTRSTLLDALLFAPRYRAEERAVRKRAQELLDLVGLGARAAEPAGQLPYGDRRRLEIARALAAGPRLLLLDEPAAGMNPAETDALMGLIGRLRRESGLTVMLIEHDMKLVMGICDRIGVLNFGKRLADGAPDTVRRDPAVIDAYLGGRPVRAAAGRAGGRRAAGAAVLAVEDLHAGYGGVQVLHGVSLAVGEGEIATVIGANGAGKSTLLRTVSGLVTPRAGAIRLAGAEIGGLPPDRVVAAGVAHIPEGRQVLARMTVLDNLRAGAYPRRDREVDADIARLLDRFPALRDRRRQVAGTLSGGEQQMLAIARGLMSRPRVLMLDEPSLGLAPLIVAQIFEIIGELNARGVPILLVEQNAMLALEVADRGYVLETGRVAMQGAARDLLGNAAVRRAYLG